MPKPLHYQGNYHVQARHIRDTAYANPNTRCWRCGLTLDERRATHPHARWTAGHLIDSTPNSPLAAECSPCNYSNGARKKTKTPLAW